MSAWTVAVSFVVSVLVWRETRHLGADLDDRELRESAPLIGGLAVGLACVGVWFVSSGLVLERVIEQGARLSAAAIVWLLFLEGVLAELGVIENEWLVMPGPLRVHAQEKIGP